ncbi:MAG TPA: T9SS type A sorting domain-containing protein [Bacteroidales bacterium]|nr:T9SS type A sorting domain-containing protein [Bacteroidales bacterium]
MSLKQLIIILSLFASTSLNVLAQADWVHLDSNNRLVYKTDAFGNRIMDYSYSGYMGGGVSIPDVPVKMAISPSTGDQTALIQNAIDQVEALPLVNGFRGALLLNPGTYDVSGQLNINASGVVVRGSGAGAGGTILNRTSSTAACFKITGSGSYSSSNTVNIINNYVPSGTHNITVSDASGFKVGDMVLVKHKVTQDWIHYLKMDLLVRDGLPQTWIAAGTDITTDRVIKAISGNVITLDAPLTENLDSYYLGNPVGTLSKYTISNRIEQVGLENLKIQAPQGATVYSAVSMDNIMNGWIRNVTGQETQNAFNINKTAKQITLDNVINNITIKQTLSAATADYSLTGTQILVNNCQSNATGTWPIVSSSTGTGPITVLNFKSTDRGISPHQRWTTGILADNCRFLNASSGNPGVSYKNRGTSGSGHGWTTGWSVAWNVETPYFLISAAPGTLNWAIGGHGTKTSRASYGDPDGIYDKLNTTVSPSSLYLQQLYERLGSQAIANIGYPLSSTGLNPIVVKESNLRYQYEPSSQKLDIQYDLSAATDIRLNIFDLRGTLLRSISEKKLEPGKYTKTFQLSGIPKGVYLIVLNTSTQAETIRMVVV